MKNEKMSICVKGEYKFNLNLTSTLEMLYAPKCNLTYRHLLCALHVQNEHTTHHRLFLILCVISGFRHSVNDTSAHLGCYAVYIG